MHKLAPLLCLLIACTSHAQPPEVRLKLSEQLVDLMHVRTMFNAYLRQCNEPEGSPFDPKIEFKANPGSFGGVSPQSAYWPEVESIYGRFRASACAYATADKFAAHYSQQLALRSSEQDLRAAIAYFSSPAGRRMQEVAVTVNESFQKFASELMLQAYGVAREQFQADIQALLRKYQKEPR